MENCIVRSPFVRIDAGIAVAGLGGSYGALREHLPLVERRFRNNCEWIVDDPWSTATRVVFVHRAGVTQPDTGRKNAVKL